MCRLGKGMKRNCRGNVRSAGVYGVNISHWFGNRSCSFWNGMDWNATTAENIRGHEFLIYAQRFNDLLFHEKSIVPEIIGAFTFIAAMAWWNSHDHSRGSCILLWWLWTCSHQTTTSPWFLFVVGYEPGGVEDIRRASLKRCKAERSSNNNFKPNNMAWRLECHDNSEVIKNCMHLQSSHH